MITMIAVGVQDDGAAVEATVKTNLFHGFTAVTNIVFAFCKHPDHKDYHKLTMAQPDTPPSSASWLNSRTPAITPRPCACSRVSISRCTSSLPLSSTAIPVPTSPPQLLDRLVLWFPRLRTELRFQQYVQIPFDDPEPC